MFRSAPFATVMMLITPWTSSGATPPTSWIPSASVSVKEEYDSNVFLQDVTSLADRESMVTTVIPSVGVKYSAGPGFSAQASYAPEAVFFHAEPTEDHVLHRFGLGASGKTGATEWDVQNALIVIDGEDEGVTFTGPGGGPAAGGPRVRDRRDAAIYRGGAKVTRNLGGLLVRPVVSAYVHDFQARHRSTPGYLNYVDRNDLNGGVDLGAEWMPSTRGFVGYRYGAQNQARLMSFPEEYDNHYHRLLFTIEGTPRKWVKIAASFGPEFRTYGDRVAAAFGSREELNLFVDASLTFTAGASDTIVVSAKQFEQPGFGGRSTYEDLTYDLVWRHKVGERLTLSTTGRAYNTDFTYPTQRDDWVLSVSAIAAWSLEKRLQTEVSMTYEDGESRLPGTTARDYSREVVAIGLRYTFR